MKIGILTYHKACNCGALIQAWALHKVLTRMGHDVSFPSCIKTGVPIFRWQFNRHRRGVFAIIDFIASCRNTLRTALYNGYLRARLAPFKRHYIAECACRAEDLAERYDLLIVGSDQVWNPKCAVPQNYQLYIGNLPCGEVPMIGYAVSCGDGNLDEQTRRELSSAAEHLYSISFREASLGTQLGIANPLVVCDPSLLLDKSDYDELASRKRMVKGEYLFAYCASQTPRLLWKIVDIGKKLGLRVVIAQIYSHWFWNKNLPSNSCVGLTPGEMVSYLRHAKYVVSSSFHGTAVAIANGVRFIHLDSNPEQQSSRAGQLLEHVGLRSRLCHSDGDMDELVNTLKAPYSVDLSKWRRKSLEFLESSLEGLTHKVN